MAWKNARFLRAGDVNLKGKLWGIAGCGCCDIFNKKYEYEVRLANEEIREAGKVPLIHE